jgi:hypothetical protein
MNEAAAQQEEEDGGVRGHLQTMPSRSKSNFTNVTPLGAKGEPQGIAWGSCSAGQRLKTYIAVPSDVDRTKLPEDQVIKTEKLNILLKHFYALGDGGHKAVSWQTTQHNHHNANLSISIIIDLRTFVNLSLILKMFCFSSFVSFRMAEQQQGQRWCDG